MKTIFFVHDQEESPAERQNCLESSGFTVKLIKNGRELLLSLKDETPDLVLMDVLLEGRNGFEICRELGSRFSSRLFPVILGSRIYTAHVFQEEGRRVGAQDYIVRPVSPEELVGRVNAVLAAWAEAHPPREAA